MADRSRLDRIEGLLRQAADETVFAAKDESERNRGFYVSLINAIGSASACAEVCRFVGDANLIISELEARLEESARILRIASSDPLAAPIIGMARDQVIEERDSDDLSRLPVFHEPTFIHRCPAQKQ